MDKWKPTYKRTLYEFGTHLQRMADATKSVSAGDRLEVFERCFDGMTVGQIMDEVEAAVITGQGLTENGMKKREDLKREIEALRNA